MWIFYLTHTLTWLLILHALQDSLGLEGECDVNLCDVEEPGFLCDTGSVILVQQVMCRTRGENCDELAYREVTRLCSGRQFCETADLWLVSGKYCVLGREKNEEQEFMSIVFVSYVCIFVSAVESNCSQRGSKISPVQRYISSPGYPALVTGNSMCNWRFNPPRGFDVDINVREYLHRDNEGNQFVRIKELTKNGLGMKLETTSKRGLTFTLKGDVELLLFTDDSTRGHRMWIEYRFVSDLTLEHLRPFPVPNRTECGSSLLNKTEFPGRRQPSSDNKLSSTTSIPETSSLLSITLTSTLTTEYMKSTRHKDFFNPFDKSTISSYPRINETDVQTDAQPDTAVTIAVAACVVGVACCIAVIWGTWRHRRKKTSAHGKNCLSSDTYSVEYDRASLNSTPSSHPYPHSRPPLPVNIPRHSSLDMVDIIRQAEPLNVKTTLKKTVPVHKTAPDKRVVIVPPTSTQQDGSAEPLDLSKYLITERQNTIQKSKKMNRARNEHYV